MSSKKLFCAVEMLWFYEDVATEAFHEWTTTLASNRVADVITQNSSKGGTGDDDGDLQTRINSRVERGQQEHGFPRKGNSHALDHHKKGNCWITEGIQRILECLKAN